MHEPVLTVVGNVGTDPRQRVLADGTVVTDFRLAQTPRRQDRASGQWVDGATIWFGVTCWRVLARHCAQSLVKGDRVVVTGRLTTRGWTTDRGEQRSSLEIDASSVGVDLSRAPVTVLRQAPAATAPEPALDPPAEEPAAPGPAADVPAQVSPVAEPSAA